MNNESNLVDLLAKASINEACSRIARGIFSSKYSKQMFKIYGPLDKESESIYEGSSYIIS